MSSKILKKKKKDDKNSDQDLSQNPDLEKDIEQLKKNLKIPVSDDSLDYLESQIDILNDTSNLDTKVQLHSKLIEYTQQLTNEIDNMTDLLEKIDVDAISELIKSDVNQSASTEVTDDIVNIESLMAKLKEEEVMQIKMLYLKKLIDRVGRCKAKCESNKLTINKCN